MGDPFRTIPIRHIGHGFAFAEAFRYNFAPETSDVCATVATVYILCHAGHRGFQTYPIGSKEVLGFAPQPTSGLVNSYNTLGSSVASMVNVLSYICLELAVRRGKLTLSTLFDTLLFDGLASALLPTVVTYYACQITDTILKSVSGVPPAVVEWGPLVMGCVTLLVTWETIDIGVNNLMNDTVRRLY